MTKLDNGDITLGEYEQMIEPLKREIQPEPCEDAVSRAEAKRILFDFAGCIVDTPNGIYQQAYKKYNNMMDNLPCVTPKPKTGKWIVNYECPVCGELRTKYTETCPCCGTKMNSSAQPEEAK